MWMKGQDRPRGTAGIVARGLLAIGFDAGLAVNAAGFHRISVDKCFGQRTFDDRIYAFSPDTAWRRYRPVPEMYSESGQRRRMCRRCCTKNRRGVSMVEFDLIVGLSGPERSLL